MSCYYEHLIILITRTGAEAEVPEENKWKITPVITLLSLFEISNVLNLTVHLIRTIKGMIAVYTMYVQFGQEIC